MGRNGVYLNVNQVRPIPYLIECFLSCASIFGARVFAQQERGLKKGTKSSFQ